MIGNMDAATDILSLEGHHVSHIVTVRVICRDFPLVFWFVENFGPWRCRLSILCKVGGFAVSDQQDCVLMEQLWTIVGCAYTLFRFFVGCGNTMFYIFVSLCIYYYLFSIFICSANLFVFAIIFVLHLSIDKRGSVGIGLLLTA